ncbi:hypothetical protein GCM10027569_76300 [Flindersiella endophytica]
MQAASADTALAACPQIFAHGGYPTGPNPWERDQVRQPNNPTALQAAKAAGSSGAEVDLQLTRDGTKGVMWHNDTTNALTGSNLPVNEIWWDTGADKLNGRTIDRGPYAGERVYTLRQFLDSAYSKNMVLLIELKSAAKQSLLNSDATIRTRAWSEVIDPIKERTARQEIMVYTHDTQLQPELTSRFNAADLGAVIATGPQRPVWPDTVGWEEPPPAATGNFASWQATLDSAPRRMATSWPQQMHDWMAGRCTT